MLSQHLGGWVKRIRFEASLGKTVSKKKEMQEEEEEEEEEEKNRERSLRG